MAASPLPPEFAALVERGISAIVASRGVDRRPSIMRAVGTALDRASGEVTVYLWRPQSRQLVLDLAATGTIAVVFSEPYTHRTVQLKASRVAIRPANDGDAPALAAYLTSMEHEIAQVGHPPEFTRAMLAHDLRETLAVSFLPEQAFDQTPGPSAGRAIGEAGR